PDRLEVRVGGVRVPPRFGEVALRGRSAGLWPRGLAAAPGPCGPQFGGEEDAAAPKQQDYEADDAGHLGAGAGVHDSADGAAELADLHPLAGRNRALDLQRLEVRGETGHRTVGQ